MISKQLLCYVQNYKFQLIYFFLYIINLILIKVYIIYHFPLLIHLHRVMFFHNISKQYSYFIKLNIIIILTNILNMLLMIIIQMFLIFLVINL